MTTTEQRPAAAVVTPAGVAQRLQAALPPGASSRSMVSKYVGQYSWPTASIISTDTTASKLPVTSR